MKAIKISIVWMALFLAFLALGGFIGSAHEDFSEAKTLIESKISCSELTDDQLEEIGDYAMEQMHPGDAHELMDQMMGGEGSEQLRQAHIAMAGRWYCGDTSGTRYGMMGAFDGASYGGMMDGFNGMMGGTMNMMGGGMMMGGYPYGYAYSWSGMIGGFLLMVLFWGLVIWFIFWLIKSGSKQESRQESGSAMDILKKRYAKGEISKKQFDEMKKELK